MRVSPIITNIQSLKKTIPFNAKKENEKTDINKSEKNNNNFMSGVLFKGYTVEQHKHICGTSGSIYKSDIDKGKYPEIKSVYERDGIHTTMVNHNTMFNSGGLDFYPKVYMADVDEYVDSYFLPEDVGFIVYYDKSKVPEIPELNQIKEDFKDKPTKYKYDIERNIDWENAWKEHYQQQYDNMSKDKTSLYDDERYLREQKLNDLSQKMYYIGEKIDTYNRITDLMSKAGDNLVKIQQRDDLIDKKGQVQSDLDYSIYKKNKFNNNIAVSEKEWQNAPESEKDEKRVLHTLEKVKSKYEDYKISQSNGYRCWWLKKQYKSLDDEISGMKEVREDLQNNISGIEKSYEYNQAINGHPDILGQMEDIYREKLPDKVDR